MLASMYDASLDQFYPHQWNKPNMWPSYYRNKAWSDRQNFVKVESNLKEGAYTELKSFEKNYDFLFTFNNRYIIYNPYGRYNLNVRQGIAEDARIFAPQANAEFMAGKAVDTIAVADGNDPNKVLKYKVVLRNDSEVANKIENKSSESSDPQKLQ